MAELRILIGQKIKIQAKSNKWVAWPTGPDGWEESSGKKAADRNDSQGINSKRKGANKGKKQRADDRSICHAP